MKKVIALSAVFLLTSCGTATPVELNQNMNIIPEVANMNSVEYTIPASSNVNTSMYMMEGDGDEKYGTGMGEMKNMNMNMGAFNANTLSPVINAVHDNANTGTSETTKKAGFTLADVQKHASKDDCWSIVEGKVYNLTSWIDRHPGGAFMIIAMCGKDSTKAFEAKHGGEMKPEKTLASFLMGDLQ